MVGFNRRFSPAAVHVKKALARLSANRAPLVINYRVNAEHFSPDLWVFGKEGGGRVIGEACHMFDFFNYFTESAVASLDVQGIRDTSGRSTLHDNFSAIVKYENGDVCTLTYTSAGHPGLGKEYVELHCGGASFVIDNFKTLTAHGVSGVSWKSKPGDKGHLSELDALGRFLNKGGGWPISLDDLVSATQLSFETAQRIT